MGQLDVLLQKSGSTNKTTTLKSTSSGNLDTLLNTNKGRITVSQPKKATTVTKVSATPAPKTNLVSQAKVKTNNIVAQSKTKIQPAQKFISQVEKEPVVKTAKEIFKNITDTAKKAVNKNVDKKVKTLEKVAVPIAKTLLKTPDLNLGNKLKKSAVPFGGKPADAEVKIVNFMSNFPSDVLRSYGRDIELIYTPKGREILKKDALDLPKTMGEVKKLIDNREWMKALEVASSNSALIVSIDAVGMLPTGLVAKSATALKGRKVAQQIVKETVEEAEKQVIKKELKVVSAGELGFKEGENKVTKISIDKIDSGLSPMMKDKKLNVDPMIATLKKGEDLPAIPVYKDGEKYILNSDGNRRYQAYLQSGIKDVPVKIQEKTKLTPLAKNNAERAIVKAEKPKEIVSERTIKTETTKKPSYTSKEARTVQESFSNEIQRITRDTGSEDELITNVNKLYDDTLPKVKGDRSALAGLRTSLNKEMFEFAGIGGGNYKANYAELKTLMNSPDIGKYLTNLEKKVQEIDELILKTPEKTKVITKKSEKVITTKEIPKPIGKGETKQSGLAVGVEAKAIEKKLTDNLGDLPEYKQVNMKDQANKAGALLTKDEQKAIDIALGKKAPPADILPESVFIAVENKAIREGNIDLLRQLANSVRTTEATAMGQRIRTLAERYKDSPVKILSDIMDQREEAFKVRYKGRSSDEIKKKVVSDIQNKVKKPNKNDWSSFVESIKC